MTKILDRLGLKWSIDFLLTGLKIVLWKITDFGLVQVSRFRMHTPTKSLERTPLAPQYSPSLIPNRILPLINYDYYS